MKHLNIKIALLALASLLAMGHGMANESGLSSTNSSTGKYSFFVKTVDIERGGASKLFLSPDLTDSPFLLVKRCEISSGGKGKPGVKGKICKTNGLCVASRKDCPRKQKSPHRRNPHADKETTLESDGI